MRFKGVIPPMITPFKKDGSVDWEAHAFNVGRWSNGGLGGLLVMGSNSEAAFLSEREKLELIRVTADTAADSLTVLAGTGLESTTGTIDLTNKAASKGAEAALVLTPHFYRGRMTDKALINHFSEIAEEAAIPILIYNVPKYTGINVPLKVVAELSTHPNIVGMKDSSGNIGQLVQLQEIAGPEFQVLTGTASVWLPALRLGVEAAIMALANCAPDICVQIQSLYETGDQSRAEHFYRLAVPVNHAVTAGFGIAGLKYVCALRGFEGGSVRRPLQDLSEREKEALAEIANRLPILPS